MRRLEFSIPLRPVSVQAKDHGNLQAWKRYVAGQATMYFPGPIVTDGALEVSIVFMCDEIAPIDVDNIIKPIQDALIGVVYSDDVLVIDTESHRRFLSDAIDVAPLPKALIELIVSGAEGVYIRVQNGRPEEIVF